MQVIRPLSDEVINKIAAGEVVERPASVVKELVENSLDAGAKRIEIEIKEGGLNLIAIRDNGKGIDREDAPFAVMRHATSKITSSEDLFTIGTMGFRGEALASISSVSLFHMQSSGASNQGFSLHFDAGQPMIVPSDLPRGTSVRVADLFYNVPARRAFLKSAGSEFSFINEVVQSYAMAYLDVGFSLTHNGKQIWHVEARRDAQEPVSALQDRLKVFGIGEQKLVRLDKSGERAQVWGLVSPPGLEKTTARWLFTFINGRWVKDKALRFAIQRGYHSHLLKGRHPVCVLFVTIDPALVDINVHPAKTEVRLQYQTDIQQVIATGIREAIREGSWGLAPTPIDSWPDTSAAQNLSSGFQPKAAFSQRNSGVSHGPASSGSRSSASSGSGSPASSGSGGASSRGTANGLSHFPSRDSIFAPPANFASAFETRLGTQHAHGSAPHDSFLDPVLTQKSTGPKFPWHEAEFLGQYKKLYWLFSCQEHLLVVDQHAFHERILFERFSANPKLLQESQRCLMPEVFSFDTQTIESLRELMPALTKRGFAMEILDELHIEITAVPTILARANLESALQEIADKGAMESSAEMLILATMACHAAVRGGDEMSAEQVTHLLRDTQDVDFYHNCPHGRPVFKWWTPQNVASWFERI